MLVYYRSADMKLRSMTSTYETVEDSIQAVMAYLHENKEVFRKPILCVIEGGKK